MPHSKDIAPEENYQERTHGRPNAGFQLIRHKIHIIWCFLLNACRLCLFFGLGVSDFLVI